MPTLTCRDVNEIGGSARPDGFEFAVMAQVAHQAFRDADAARTRDGKQAFLPDWSEDGLTGQIAAVFYSCQRHPTDTLNQRARAMFDEYVAVHNG